MGICQLSLDIKPIQHTLQTIQNKALRIATGCTHSTPIDHLHQETKVLKVKDHLNMRGTQILAAATSVPQHPLYYMAGHHTGPRDIKTTPCDRYYKELPATLPPCPPRTNMHKHIHNHFTQQAIQSLTNNTIIQSQPPEVHTSERSLTREDRVHLARLRCGHHPALQAYRNRLDETISEACPNCTLAPHSIQHLMEDCPSLILIRQQYNIHSRRQLWESPVQTVDFLRCSGLLVQRA